MTEIKVHKFENQNLEYLEVKNNAKKAVVLLHGYGASMNDLFDLNYYLDPEGNYDFYFPDGILKLQMGMGYEGRAWFPIDMAEVERHMQSGTYRDFSKLTPPNLENSLEILKNYIEKLISQYDEIVIGGFSQGAMLSSLLISEFSGILNRAIILSGNLIAENFFEKSKLEKLEFIQSHGKQDPILGILGAKRLFEKFQEKGARGEFIEFLGGHEIPMSVIEATKKFLLK